MPFCTQCGISNADGARFCGRCGASVAAGAIPAQPVSYTVQPAPPPFVQVVPAGYLVPRPPKSVGAAILLAILFGPLGMLYSTVSGALIMLVVSLILGIATAGISVLITWPICIIWGAVAAQSYNEGR
jgi:hypothetical protein